MKTREQYRNNKRTEIEQIDWFTEQIQMRVAFGWLREHLAEKTSCPRTCCKSTNTSLWRHTATWLANQTMPSQVSRQSCPWPLKLMTLHAVERTWIRTSRYEQLRGEWVNNFILATKLTELIEDVRWCILLQVKFDLRWLLNFPLATGL